MDLLFGEEIRDVLGYEGLYSVTSEGRVWSHISEKWLAHGIKTRGHHQVRLYNSEGVTDFLVHDLVLRTFRGPPPSSEHLCSHWNDDKDNNRLSNLSWATHLENAERRRVNSTYNKGESNGSSKLTNLQAEEARVRRQAGELVQDLAEEYGVHETIMRNLLKGRSYSNAGGPLDISSANPFNTAGKLSIEQAEEIRERIVLGESQTSLAIEYGVTNPTIWRIWKNITYRSKEV